MKKKWRFILIMLLLIAAGGYLAATVSSGDLLLAEQPAGIIAMEPVVVADSFSGIVTNGYEEVAELLRQEEEAAAALEDSLDEYETLPIEVTPRRPGEKVAYLTFDDGPGEYTEELLDILDEYGVKATFLLSERSWMKAGRRFLKT